MAGRIEDHAIVGDMQSAALIGTHGLLALRNGVCSLSEEYDPRYGRLAGNMPQAFSHVPLVQTGLNLSSHAGEYRGGTGMHRDERRSVPG